MSKIDTDHLIDNAATASQNGTLLDDPVTREAIKLNVIDPLLLKQSRMQEVLNHCRIALAGYVSIQSAIDMLDKLGE